MMDASDDLSARVAVITAVIRRVGRIIRRVAGFIWRRRMQWAGAGLVSLGLGVEAGFSGFLSFIALLAGIDLLARHAAASAVRGEARSSAPRSTGPA